MKRALRINQAAAAIAFSSVAFAHASLGQAVRESLAGEAAAEQAVNASVAKRYNFPIGSGGINLKAGLQGEYRSNVYLREDDVQDEFILSPRLTLDSFFPVGRMNALSLDLETSYYHYFKHDDLNTETPLINPGSELAFSIYTGDFVIKLHESFSYQESPLIGGGNYYNVYDTGLFRRFENTIGPSVTWDLHHLILQASYDHFNLWSNDEEFEYINRASELFSASAMFAVHPKVTAGLELSGSINAYDETPWNDNWRYGAGPGARLNISESLTASAGAGYQGILFDSKWTPVTGTDGMDTYYAYLSLENRLNSFLRHSLNISHDNQSGINAANLEGTHVRYSLSWIPRERWTVTPSAGVSFYEESMGSASAAMYDEKFTRYYVAIRGGYQFLENVRADLGWAFTLKDSDRDNASYDNHRITATVTYSF